MNFVNWNSKIYKYLLFAWLTYSLPWVHPIELLHNSHVATVDHLESGQFVCVSRYFVSQRIHSNVSSVWGKRFSVIPSINSCNDYRFSWKVKRNWSSLILSQIIVQEGKKKQTHIKGNGMHICRDIKQKWLAVIVLQQNCNHCFIY